MKRFKCKCLFGLIIIPILFWCFYIIDYWGNWEAVSALATIFAAIGAVVAASIAAFAAYQTRIATNFTKESAKRMVDQHQLDIDWRKRERTFSYSLTRNEDIKNAILDLKDCVSFSITEELPNTISKEIIDHPMKMSRLKLESFLSLDDKKIRMLEVKYDKITCKSQIDLVANFYGLLATELNGNLIDEPTSKNLYFFQFMRFGFVFRKNLTNKKHAKTYENFNKLYDQWKNEFLIESKNPHN